MGGRIALGRAAILVGIGVSGMATAVLAQNDPRVPATAGLTQENVVREALAEFPDMDAMAFNGVFAANASSGKHRHPGTEVLHVISGHGQLLQEGHEPLDVGPGATVVSQPDAKGGSFVHELRNTSTTEPLRTYIVLLIDKNEPPALPVN